MRLRKRNRDPKIEWLRSQPWWSELPEQDLKALAATGDRVRIGPGELVMSEGHRGYEAGVVISGEVEVSHDGEVLARLGPGAVVGELSLLDHAPRNADVQTVTDVELLVFSTRGLQQALAASADVRRQVEAAAAEHRR